MSEPVRCYGGPLHGQEIRPSGRRFDAPDARMRFVHLRQISLRPQIPTRDDFRTATYEVETFQEMRGNMRREKRVAVVEGHKNLLPRELHELERDMDNVKWQPVRMPRFLTEFERWYNVNMYLITGRSEFIQEELTLT